MNQVSSKSDLFIDLLGQPLAISFLQAALFKKRIAPAYLFAGPNGVGKRLAALRFFEGVLNGGESNALQRRRLEAGNHPDLLWIEPTYLHQGRLILQSKANEEGFNSKTYPQIRLEQIRELTSFLAKQPVEAERGMVVIESVEAMPEAAANALLKTLEEPRHGLIILLSNIPEKLLSTIRSRCQLVLFSSLSSSSIQEVFRGLGVEENHDLFTNDNHLLLRLAAGSPGGLIQHQKFFSSIPEELWARIQPLPKEPIEALALAKEISEKLDFDQQLWIIEWLQHKIWIQFLDPKPLKRLEILRFQLIGYVQPRLAWEVALLELISFN